MFNLDGFIPRKSQQLATESQQGAYSSNNSHLYFDEENAYSKQHPTESSDHNHEIYNQNLVFDPQTGIVSGYSKILATKSPKKPKNLTHGKKKVI